MPLSYSKRQALMTSLAKRAAIVKIHFNPQGFSSENETVYAWSSGFATQPLAIARLGWLGAPLPEECDNYFDWHLEFNSWFN